MITRDTKNWNMLLSQIISLHTHEDTGVNQLIVMDYDGKDLLIVH